VRAAVDEAFMPYGRDPTTLRRSLVVAIALEGPMTAREGPLKGTPDEIADSLMAIGRQGIDEVQVVMFPTNRASVDFLARVIEKLDGDVPSRA